MKMKISVLLSIALILACLPVAADTPQSAENVEKSIQAPANQSANEFSDWEIEVAGKAFYAWRLRGDTFEQGLRDEIYQSSKENGSIPKGMRCVVSYTFGLRDALAKFKLIRSSGNQLFDQLVQDTLQKKQEQGIPLIDLARREHRSVRLVSRAVELYSERISKKESDVWWPWHRKIIETLDSKVGLAMLSGVQ